MLGDHPIRSPARPSALARDRADPIDEGELPVFLVTYATYTLARWLFVGDLAEAQEHARWIHEH